MLQGPISGAVNSLRAHDHLCLIYESPEEHLAAAMPFLASGLKNGERCLYIVDDATAETVHRAMKGEGIDVGAARDSGALYLLTKKEAYLRDGYFSPERMIDLLSDHTRQAKGMGYRALRMAAEMTWALGTEPGRERLLEYESRLNRFFTSHECLAACQYNRTRFSAQIIRDILYTHPIVIHGSLVFRNMFYIPPEEYLAPAEQQAALEVDRILRQLRALEQAQSALVRSEKLAVTGRLSATIAHEINNPLEATMNLLYLAQSATTLDDLRPYLHLAQEQLARVGAIARQTLAFYRDSTAPEPVSIRDVLHDISAIYQERLARLHIAFRNETSKEHLVLANRGELRQVLSNLVANAIDAVAGCDASCISISTRSIANAVQILISDNGPGIPPEHLAHIFEPFFTTKEQHGTGLGLWVCEDLVARQRGSLAVETHTSGPVRGTTFTITLPSAAAPNA